MSKKEKIITLQEIKKSYFLAGEEYPILKGINLEIKEGEFVALMGPSGSGKSTLMNIIGCLDIADKGQYILNGHDVSHMSNNELAAIRNRYIGFVFQNFNLLPRLSSLRNVSLPSFYHDRENLERARELLIKVGLEERLDNKPSELSGGQRQRVAIARALMNDPTLILADEPTGNLDSKSAQETMKLLKELNEEQNKTIVLVTHDDYTASFAGRIIHLKDGEILKENNGQVIKK